MPPLTPTPPILRSQVNHFTTTEQEAIRQGDAPGLQDFEANEQPEPQEMQVDLAAEALPAMPSNKAPQAVPAADAALTADVVTQRTC